MFKLRIIAQPTRLLKRSMTSTESSVLFQTVDNAGIITLNRPSTLNSINTSMLSKLMQKLPEWESNKHLVLMKGAGGKAFCAGGDVKAASNPVEGPKFFHSQFNVNYLILKYKIPYISLMNGITMGVGLGLSINGRYRVATEKTLIAMPEAKIGLFSVAGCSYFLQRLPLNLGLYISLTGDRLKGKDVVKAGIATHFVPDKHLNELEKLLADCQNNSEVESILSKFSEPLDEFSLAPNIEHINYCFGASTMEEIIERLKNVQNDWSVKTLKTLQQMCPGALKIILLGIQRGVQLELPEVLRMEYRLAVRATRSHDFPEGVRAFLIDKDNNPQWNHKSLTDVSDDYVEEYFKQLPEDQELKFLSL